MTWTYAPAPESAALANLQPAYRPFIDGEFVDGNGSMKTVNPATEEVLAEVGTASSDDVDRAVAAARRAYETTWGPMPGAERAKYLFRIARIVAERARELAVLETLDNGKPIRESRDVDVPTAAAHLFHHAGWADKLEYAGLGPSPKPLGVVGAVIPWNFPLLMAAWKVAPALATGNTIVLKPAETTPLTALVLAEIAAEAGLPAGVLNVLPGAGDVGAAVVATPASPRWRSPARPTSGSRSSARSRAPASGSPWSWAARRPTSCTTTRRWTRPSRASSRGSSSTRATCAARARGCSCRSRSPTSSMELLRARITTLRVGDPLDKNTDVGAINSRAQLDKIVDLAAAGDAEGARRWTSPCPLPERGLFFPPTVFSDVEQTMRVAREEIFGPVLSVLTFRTPAEAVAKANNTPYGLSAGVWTDKGAKAMWTARQLRAGVVWTNTFNRFDPTSPFGGMGESGFGREGGRAGLAAYLDG